MIDEHADAVTFRADAARFAATLPRALPALPSGTYEVVDVGPAAPVRRLNVYRPAGPGVPGVFVNLHGGGFVLGSAQDDDPYCRLLADASGCAVVNVDYPLAPEHPYPAAVHQTYDLLAWIAEHGGVLGVDGSRLAVGGHSAGGNLAAACALLARRHGRPLLRGVVVDYAPLDLWTPPADKLVGPVRDDPGATALAEAGARFNAWYLPDPASGADELASPVLASDVSGLPPTLVLTAERDLLRAEGDRYAARLSAAGVPTEHAVFPGCGHGFTHVGPEEHAAAAWARMAAFVRRVVGVAATSDTVRA
ncbi:alpha/beta hydrolase [Cellulomonas sp.]|uniref:alpha/beta hydrolase n=1 Tax=Cellulomonas sp. TaxID=40001 RepID=UPI001B1BE103|nr:alpha/beta hydrolase [Cellulomonas sp.]MBO9556637.1 alpha/beta hydrolase [Cellulomonas sp.]